MELLQLKYFCDAAKTQNFSETARTFMVPPSDISQSIKRLERELGTGLFDRQSNKIKLNETGRVFYGSIKSALEQIELATQQVHNTESVSRLNICIKVNRRITMQAIEKFRLQYPDVDIIVRHVADNENEKFDIIIDDKDHFADGYRSEKAFSENIVLAVNKKDPIADKESITADDLKDYPFITMNSGNSIHSVTLEVCKQMGVVPRIAIQSDDPFYIRRCVELGLGVAVIPALSWRGQFSDTVRFKSLVGSVRNTYICRLESMCTSSVTELFISILKTEFEKEENLTIHA